MFRCDYCLNPLQIAHKKTNDCLACKYYKGYENNFIGIKYKLINRIFKFCTKGFPKDGDDYNSIKCDGDK